MIRNPGFSTQKLAGQTYLLPFGQQVVNYARGILLDETGEFLMELLTREHTLEQLVEQVMLSYGLPQQERTSVAKDIAAYTDTLLQMGVLLEHGFQPKSPLWETLSIGGLRIGLHGADNAFSQELSAFSQPNGSWDIVVDVVDCPPPEETGCFQMLDSPSLLVRANGSHYLLSFPDFSYIRGVSLAFDGSWARVFRASEIPGSQLPQAQEELFHVLRHIYTLAAQQRGIFVLHSVSILYRGRAWLFAGHSGMGKSTHTAMWHKLVGTPILNGDLNLLRMGEDGKPMVCGLPWCGTSGTATPGVWPLGGIILLGRGNDRCVELNFSEQALQTAQRLISPVWTEEMLGKNLAFSLRLTQTVPIYKLLCTKEPSAVDVIRHQIDAYLSREEACIK